MTRDERPSRPDGRDKPAAPLLTVHQARDLAGDLLRQLTEHAGHPAEVDALCRRWVDELDAPRFALICMAALRAAFADCMTPAQLDDQAPPGALIVTAPEETR